jgi:prevent-host-death family protein
MSWKIAQAKQHLSDVVRQAAKEPQVLTNRDRVVAAVVGAEEFERFQQWRSQRSLGSIAEALSQARQICAEEDYSLDVPARGDRENPILKRPRASARHKRHQ